MKKVVWVRIEAKILSQNNKPNRGRKMKKFYEVYVSVRENELYCTED